MITKIKEVSDWTRNALGFLFITLVNKIFTFVPGRNSMKENPYYKCCLIESKKFQFDVYLLLYPKGSFVSWHRDPAPKGYVHKRLNFIIVRPDRGGQFLKRNKSNVVETKSRFSLFDASEITHAVTTVKSGQRLSISMGWLRRIR